MTRTTFKKTLLLGLLPSALLSVSVQAENVVDPLVANVGPA